MVPIYQAIFLAVLGQLGHGASRCPTIFCPLKYDPVCGSDGKTYSNGCALNAAKCHDPTLTFVSSGMCRSSAIKRADSCPMICPMIYSPVCGSDGKTYGNKCEFEATKCRDSSLTMVSQSTCSSARRRAACLGQVCTADYTPVCGTDGITYSNKCYLSMMSCLVDSKLQVAYTGSCAVKRAADCPAGCPRIWAPVCGSDGRTYGNMCELNVTNCRNPDANVKFAYQGTCDQGLASRREVNCDVACTEEYQPMCGTDEKTYDNKCYLKVAHCKTGGAVGLAYPGPCKAATSDAVQPSRRVADCGIVCAAVFDPVCGTDANTYSNTCMLKVAACKAGSSIGLAYKGPCRDDAVQQNTCDAIVCTDEYAPVCGSDGKTYSNQCELKTASCKAGGSLTLAHAGACRDASLPQTNDGNCNAVVCTDQYDPVCGTDGNTYSNKCQLKVTSCKAGGSLGLASAGPCKDDALQQVINKRADCDMACFAIYDPVCGTDGKTYSNKCALKVASCKLGGSLGLAYSGTCKTDSLLQQALSKRASCPQFCTMQYQPVCGSDGKTYSNGCFLQIATCKSGGSITMASMGSCGGVDGAILV